MKLAKKLKGKRWLYGPLISLGTIILCLSMAEVLSRLLLSEEVSSVIQLEWKHNASFWRQATIRKEAGKPVLCHTPLSTSFSTTKPSGTFRVVFLGDSMTDLFTALLETSLNLLPTDDEVPARGYEILNFGVGGYNLEQIEQVFYEALAFEPDLIIYNYFVNDLNIVSQVKSRDGVIEILSYGQSVPYLLQFPGNGKLLHHSRAFRYLNKKLSVVIQKLDPGFTPRSFDIGWERAEQSLDRMIAAARSEQVPFVIMLSPDFCSSEITGSYNPGNFIMNSCHSGLSVWDVSRELAPYYTSEELRISEEDFHPNRRGNAAISEALQLYFKRYVLDKPTLEHLVPRDDKEVPCTVV